MKIPSDAKDITAMRAFFTEVRQQMCSMADNLSEPWKTHFNGLKEHYDQALAALPPTDAVPAAMEANKHLSAFYSCLANANALCSMLGASMASAVKDADAKLALALNSAVAKEVLAKIAAGELVAKADLAGLVAAALADRVKTGDFVEKATVLQLCSQATTTGLTQGEKKVRDEQAATAALQMVITTRKTHLQTCGVPVPDAALEAVLGGTEEAFAALQKTAEQRVAALQKKGVALNSKSPLGAKVWLPADQWTVFESLVTETIKGGDPLAAAPAHGAADAPKVMVC